MNATLGDAERDLNEGLTLPPKSSVPVLIVDDNAAKRLAVKAVLLPLGYPVVEADSGIAALRHVMAQDFAVILLDVCMPIMDGFETAALIRQRKQSEMTPIIFFTAYGSDDIADTDRYAEGAVDFMFAPVPPNELRAKVSVFANLFIKAEALATRAREVQTSADELRLLTDAAPIGIFQTDGENRYVYTNPRWSEITGIAPEDAAGRKWGTILSFEDRGELVDFTPDLSRGGAERTELCHRFEIRPPGSVSRIVLITAKLIPQTDGGFAGWVGTLADVTAEVGAEAAMSTARDEANEASRLKSDFLTNMSHEIRTPMNGVIGMTDLLLETDLDDRQRDYAQTVRNSSEALLTIINDILDFSKIEAGKLDVEDIEFSVASIVHDVVDLLAGPAQAKDLELVAAVESSVPAVVRGDPGRVRQVLTNLIGNAIKFTKAGEIAVLVTGTKVVDGETIVRFEVSDTGDGIEPDKLALIFQPFVQADTSTSRKYGGTGLGLAISGQLVALMRGDCGVSSRLGLGSDFWFTICVHADAGQVMHDLLTPQAGFAGVKALIVDDNATQRNILADCLSAWGMTVLTAEGGGGALETLRAAAADGRPFAVAVVDRFMPGMDGLQLKDAIGDDAALSTPVVLMTGLGHERDLGIAAAGVSASLSKPVHREELRACLRVALGLQTAHAASTAGHTRRPAPSGERAVGRLLLAEDNLINQKVAVAMLSSAGYVVDTVPDGAAAVLAVAAQRYDAILMDCQMPELNGYEATAAIRAQEGTDRHTPIIAMTAGARGEDRQRCLAEGMDDYLAKPVSKDALLALVARSVKNGPAAEATIDAAVLGELRVLGAAANHDFVGELVDQFVLDTEPLLEELRQSFEAGDAPAVGRIAHTIKGSSGQLGGRRLAGSCAHLEAQASSGTLSEGPTNLREVEFDYQQLCLALAQLSPEDRQRPGFVRA
ncbi:MAG: two-component system, sensor histidine kinase and response regulator [Acidimicrobiaceae bacterium]